MLQGVGMQLLFLIGGIESQNKYLTGSNHPHIVMFVEIGVDQNNQWVQH